MKERSFQRHGTWCPGLATRAARRRLAAALSFLALSAHLLLPLVVTCRTYLSLTRDAPVSCCPSMAACEPDNQRAAAPSWRVDELKCPFCKSASPFRHANRVTAPSLLASWHPITVVAPSVPASAPQEPPDLSQGSPRSPPVPS